MRWLARIHFIIKNSDGLLYTFHTLVARENARFQNYANRATGARNLARRRRGGLEKLKQYKGFGAVAVAACRIPRACASDRPSRAMQKLSMGLIACACVSAAAMSAQLRRTNPYTSSNSRSPASGGHTGILYCYSNTI